MWIFSNVAFAATLPVELLQNNKKRHFASLRSVAVCISARLHRSTHTYLIEGDTSATSNNLTNTYTHTSAQKLSEAYSVTGHVTHGAKRVGRDRPNRACVRSGFLPSPGSRGSRGVQKGGERARTWAGKPVDAARELLGRLHAQISRLAVIGLKSSAYE